MSGKYKVIERCLDENTRICGVILLDESGVKTQVGMEQLSYLLGKKQIVNYSGCITAVGVDIKPRKDGIELEDLPLYNRNNGEVEPPYKVIKRYKKGRILEGFGILFQGKEIYTNRQEAIRLCKSGLVENMSVQLYNGNYIFRGKGISLEDIETININTDNTEKEEKPSRFSNAPVLSYFANSFSNAITSAIIKYPMLNIQQTMTKNNKAIIWRLIRNNKESEHQIKNIDIILDYEKAANSLSRSFRLSILLDGEQNMVSDIAITAEDCQKATLGLHNKLIGYFKSMVVPKEKVNNYLELMNDISKNVATKLKEKTKSGYSNGIIAVAQSTSIKENNVISIINLKLKDNTIINASLFCDNTNRFTITNIIDDKNNKYTVPRVRYIFSSADIEDCAKNILLGIMRRGILSSNKETTLLNEDILSDKFKTAIKSIKMNLIDDVNNNYSSFIKNIDLKGLGNNNGRIIASIVVEFDNNNKTIIDISCDKCGLNIDKVINNNKEIKSLLNKTYSFRPLGAAQLTSDIVSQLENNNIIH